MNSQRLSSTDALRILDRLAELSQDRSAGELWRIEEEPHSLQDGTTHFTHVRTTGDVLGEPVEVSIGRYVTPPLAELLVGMRNNLPELLRLARRGLEAEMLARSPNSETRIPKPDGVIK